MTNKEILQADMLDILFEHRNKSYGAYTLRRYYNNRLIIAVSIALSAVVLFYLISLLNERSGESGSLQNIDKGGVTLTQVEIPKPKEDLPQIKKPEPIAQKDFRVFQIVDDKDVKKPIAEQNELIHVAISNIDEDGKTPDDLSKAVTNVLPATDSGRRKEKQIVDFKPEEKPPTFPGGPEALALFFSRNLSSPTDLEAGEKKIAMVRFVVGADGAISSAEITQSDGDSYDREVLRAFKRMPKWNPAIQNGSKIAVSFTQPVTFVGVEQ
ncbi:MAG: TonB family protein [Bacteroidota bacterium]